MKTLHTGIISFPKSVRVVKLKSIVYIFRMFFMETNILKYVKNLKL